MPRRSHLSGCILIVFTLVRLGISDETAQTKPIITCSTTQIADFTRQVAGDRCEVLCVLASGQDPHTFEITPAAVRLVRKAVLCLDNGMYLEGDDWMRTLAEQEGKPIQSCTEGIKPVMIEEDGEAKAVPDPHAWFSPMNAAIYVTNIRRAICSLLPEHTAEFESRAELYLAQLRSLHTWSLRQFNAIPPAGRILVTSHDAFNYFCDAYQFTASAPVGWSTQEIGVEMTPASRKRVVDSIRKAGVPAIFVETSVNPEMIQGIAKEAGVKVGGSLYSDSMGVPGSAGETYIGMMRENVLTITSALIGTDAGSAKKAD